MPGQAKTRRKDLNAAFFINKTNKQTNKKQNDKKPTKKIIQIAAITGANTMAGKTPQNKEVNKPSAL